MKFMRYRQPSLSTLLGVTKAERRVKARARHQPGAGLDEAEPCEAAG